MPADNARVIALPRLFEGPGALFSRERVMHDPSLLEAVGYVTGLDASLGIGVIEEACDLLGESEDQRALTNALGGGDYRGKPLAERRRLMAETEGITERSLYRREARAVEPFLHHVGRLSSRVYEAEKAQREVKTLFGGWDDMLEILRVVAGNDPELFARMASVAADLYREKETARRESGVRL